MWGRAMGVMGVLVGMLVAGGCASSPPPGGGRTDSETGTALSEPTLIVTELCADNEGVVLDEALETEDWIELRNVTPSALDLAGYTIVDQSGRVSPLPNLTLAGGDVLVLFADEQLEQGASHLRFSLSSRGDELVLRDPQGDILDAVSYDSLGVNESLARFGEGRSDFEVCPFATPGKVNGQGCGPTAPEELPPEVEFADFPWPEPWPPVPTPLVLTELALRPARFIEVLNASTEVVELSGYELRLSATEPGAPWPLRAQGSLAPWPVSSLSPGQRVAVAISETEVAAIAATAQFEGVVSLWGPSGDQAVDRLDFMSWPKDAVLARVPDEGGLPRLCAVATRGAANDDCQPLLSRPIGDRVRRLLTPGDFSALAAGGTEVGSEAVKFIVDLDAGGAVHLLSNTWDLHYTFVREAIEGLPHLDRCDPEENALFHQGWGEFSEAQYYEVEGRRYLLGTMVHYPGSGLHTVEFVAGDRIVGSQMSVALFAIAGRALQPRDWFIRPATTRQVEECRAIEGKAPLVDPQAPFRGMTYQGLNSATSYGVLRFVPAADMATAALGIEVIVVTDLVPNDIPLVGGVITESFQTPLSHVNILSKARGTPNMALLDARHDPRIAPFLEELVRFVVTPGGFELELASVEEAEAFWESFAPSGEVFVPRLDTAVRDLRPLASLTLVDLPSVGAKAAQLGQLGRIESAREGCLGLVPAPRNGFAVPVVHFLEHFDQSGAAGLLQGFEEDPAFRTDPAVRASKLAEVRQAVLAHPVDQELLTAMEAEIKKRFGTARVRLRSSSNTEDLVGFSGAGLYTSTSAALGDSERPVDDAVRTVWASLMNARAYEERSFARIDGSTVAMGVLVHDAFLSEEANGVLISRNLLDPTRSDQHYVSAQAGEASVTNPAPGVTSDEMIYYFAATPRSETMSRSSLVEAPVLSFEELSLLTCYARSIHEVFKELLDPLDEQRWFAMDLEWKLVDGTRRLAIKQARPYSFGRAEIPKDCREF